MGLIGTILFCAVVVALAVTLLLLITPVEVKIQMVTVPKVSWQCDLRGLAGLTPQITVFDSSRPRKSKVDTPKVTRRPPHAKRRRNERLKAGRILKAVPPFLRAVLRNIHVDKLLVNCEFGLEDPADTGQLAGIMLALTHGLPHSRRVSITTFPNFQQQCFEGEIAAVFRLTVAAFLLPAILFVWRAFGPVR